MLLSQQYVYNYLLYFWQNVLWHAVLLQIYAISWHALYVFDIICIAFFQYTVLGQFFQHAITPIVFQATLTAQGFFSVTTSLSVFITNNKYLIS